MRVIFLLVALLVSRSRSKYLQWRIQMHTRSCLQVVMSTPISIIALSLPMQTRTRCSAGGHLRGMLWRQRVRMGSKRGLRRLVYPPGGYLHTRHRLLCCCGLFGQRHRVHPASQRDVHRCELQFERAARAGHVHSGRRRRPQPRMAHGSERPGLRNATHGVRPTRNQRPSHVAYRCTSWSRVGGRCDTRTGS